MRCAMPTKVIKLPCKARELAETIRCFCEHNGSFDTAVVKLVAVGSIESLMSGVRLIVTIPKEAKQ